MGNPNDLKGKVVVSTNLPNCNIVPYMIGEVKDMIDEYTDPTMPFILPIPKDCDRLSFLNFITCSEVRFFDPDRKEGHLEYMLEEAFFGPGNKGKSLNSILAVIDNDKRDDSSPAPNRGYNFEGDVLTADISFSNNILKEFNSPSFKLKLMKFRRLYQDVVDSLDSGTTLFLKYKLMDEIFHYFYKFSAKNVFPDVLENFPVSDYHEITAGSCGFAMMYQLKDSFSLGESQVVEIHSRWLKNHFEYNGLGEDFPKVYNLISNCEHDSVLLYYCMKLDLLEKGDDFNAMRITKIIDKHLEYIDMIQ